jgi:hypothetical protein
MFSPYLGSGKPEPFHTIAERIMSAVTRLITALLLITPFVLRGDDVFLINGCVYRNVRVIDSTSTVIRVDFNGRNLSIRKSMIDHIEKRSINDARRAVYELYSSTMSESFKATRWVEEEAASAQMTAASIDTKTAHGIPDTTAKYYADREMPASYSFHATAALRMDAPLGAGLEFGLRIGHVSGWFALYLAEAWSAQSYPSACAGVSLNLFSNPLKWDAYICYMRGSTFLTIEGSPETYNMIAGGVRLFLNKFMAVRLEAGYVNAHCCKLLPTSRSVGEEYVRELALFGLALEFVL